MRRTLFFISFSILFSVILQSCSIEKRLYLSGYHVEWKTDFGDNHATQVKSKSLEQKMVNDSQNLTAENCLISTTEPQETDNSKVIAHLTASIDNKIIPNRKHKTTLHRLNLNNTASGESNVHENSSELSNQRLFGRGFSSHDMMVRRPHWASKLGFVLGIASLFCWLFYLPLCIFAIGFSILGMIKSSKFKSMKYNGLGLALIGLVLGIFTTLIYVLFLASHLMLV